MATRSNLEGVAALTRQLIALRRLDDGKALRAACRAGMKPALERAKANIPVGTQPHRLAAAYGKLLVAPGYARNALRVITTINSDKNIASSIMSTRKAAFYATRFVEFGTRYQAPQPWLRRSFYDARADAEGAFRDSLSKAVIRAAKTP